MRRFPAPIQNLVTSLTRLPGVGPKTALRYVYAIMRLSETERIRFAQAVQGLNKIHYCKICFTHSEDIMCEICSDEKRETTKLCVVAEARDISTIEATNAYTGKYFVLGGTLNPIEGDTPETLHVVELLQHIEADPRIKEVILAFSPDVNGETTILYLTRKVKELGRKTTRLARGLPMGADIEYADEVTLGDALLGRRET